MACVGTVSVQSTFTLMSCPCGGGGGFDSSGVGGAFRCRVDIGWASSRTS